MARILRGDIRWANMNPTVGAEQAGMRPVLVVSKNVFNERAGTVIAVALTSRPQKAGYPLTLGLMKIKNLPKRTWVKVSQIRTLSVQRLGEKISSANEEEISQVIEGLNEIIGA
jgi:mRNA interferase MazF